MRGQPFFRFSDEDTKKVMGLASQLLGKFRFRITGTESALQAVMELVVNYILEMDSE